jgi:tRNA 2-thiouridine synthesizing protein A
LSEIFEEKIMKADEILDCVGLYCPMPIVKTAQQIKKMKVGEILEVAADDKGIKQDMPAWCEATGNECLGMEEQGGEIKVYVKKTKD